MTDIDKLAMEIAASQKMHHADEIHIARLGLEAGMKLQRERDAVIIELTLQTEQGDEIAQAIRSAL